MANMGSSKHLKRYKAPKSWPIHPKEDTWTVKPSPGSHSINDSIPLTLVIRDVLKLADNAREAKRIINSGNVLVDGRIVKDYKFPVGFMDLIEIPKTGVEYPVLERVTVRSIEMAVAIAGKVLEKDLSNMDWQTMYQDLIKENKQAFWRSFIDKIEIDPLNYKKGEDYIRVYFL